VSRYSDLVLLDSPAAYWRLGDTADSSGGGRTLTAAGGAGIGNTVGLAGAGDSNATQLSGGGDYAYAASPLPLLPTWTCEAWVEVLALPSNGLSPALITEEYPGGLGGINYALGLYSYGTYVQVWAGFYSNVTGWSAGSAANAIAGYTLAVGVKYHVAATFDGTTVKLYVNGNLVASTAQAGATPTNAGTRVFLGRRWDGSTEFLCGVIDEAAVYDYALTGAQIAQHAAAADYAVPVTPTRTLYPSVVLDDRPELYYRFNPVGYGEDATGNGHTMNATVWGVVSSLIYGETDDYAFQGDGSTTYGAAPNSPRLDTVSALTLEAWIKPTGTLSGTTCNVLRQEGAWLLRRSGTSIEVYLPVSGGSWDAAIVYDAGLVTGTLYHVAATWDGTTARLYIDGRQVAEAPFAYSGDGGSKGYQLAIGSYIGAGTERWVGTLDELAVYRYALTADQVLTHYDAGKTGTFGLALASSKLPRAKVELAVYNKPLDPYPRWVDVTRFVRSVSTRTGRQNQLGRYEAGTATVELDNRDRRFDPVYAGAIGNYITNPDFTVDTAGWARESTQLSFSVENGSPPAGSSQHAALRAAASPPGGYMRALTTVLAAGDINGRYVAAVNVRAAAGSAVGKTFTLRVWDGVDGSRFTTVTLTTAYQLVTLPVTLSNTNPVSVYVGIEGTAVTNDKIYFGRVSFGPGTTFAGYIDGNTDNCRWEGTPHASRTYQGGPYYGQLKVARRLRVRSSWKLMRYPEFDGFAERLPQRWPVVSAAGKGDAVTQLEASDWLKVLSLYEFDAAYSRPAETTGQRAEGVLEAAGVPFADRQLDIGASALVPVAAGGLEGQQGLSHLQDVADAEGGGGLYATPAGKVRFEGRGWRALVVNRLVKATFGDAPGELPYKSLTPEYGDDDLYNDVRVTASTGAAQTATDSSSVGDYFRRVLSKSLSIMASPTEALSVAQSLLNVHKDPDLLTPIIEVQAAGDADAAWPVVLPLAISDRVQLLRRPPGGGTLTKTQIVEGRAVNITPETYDVVFNLGTSKGLDSWVLSTSALGADTSLGT
jgi:hypothetical protein